MNRGTCSHPNRLVREENDTTDVCSRCGKWRHVEIKDGHRWSYGWQQAETRETAREVSK